MQAGKVQISQYGVDKAKLSADKAKFRQIKNDSPTGFRWAVSALSSGIKKKRQFHFCGKTAVSVWC